MIRPSHRSGGIPVWQMTIHDKRRFLFSVLGITFAVVLMLVELGFLNAIYDSATLWAKSFDADLIMVSPHKNSMNADKPFPMRRLEQVRGFDGVEGATPVYMSRLGRWHSIGSTSSDVLRVLGIDPNEPAFRIPEIQARQSLLHQPDVALFDAHLRDSYGGLDVGTIGEINGRRIEIVGDFHLGPDLQLNSTFIVGDLTFERIFSASRTPDAPAILEEAEFGLIRLKDGVSPTDAAELWMNDLPDDVVLLTPDDLSRVIRWFWTVQQPAGMTFGVGFVIGFFIGMMICYQILYTDVLDQLPQYAALKAIGYENRDLLSIAVQRSVHLAFSALAVGLPLGLVSYEILARVTVLQFNLTFFRAAGTSVATVLMCVIAGVLAMREAFLVDPAEVFQT